MTVHTVFVVGAGASQEAGLPFGKTFREEIASRLAIDFDPVRGQTHGDKVITQAIINHCRAASPQLNADELFAVCHRISRAMTQASSIDKFIDNHANDERIALCGKLAIVRAILAAEERTSMLERPAANRYVNFVSFEETWYNRFWRLLIDRCTSIQDITKRLAQVLLVIFNYDRCVEQFLYCSLKNYFDCSDETAANVLTHLRVYHPYGTVGLLSWQKSPGVPFGADSHASQVIGYASGIRTFTEKLEPTSPDVRSIRAAIYEASRVVFLGFGFDEDNVRLLTTDIESPIGRRTKFFATALGLSDSNVAAVIRQLHGMKRHASLVDDSLYYFVNNKLACVGLFDEYWKDLALP